MEGANITEVENNTALYTYKCICVCIYSKLISFMLLCTIQYVLNIFDSIFDGRNEPGYKQLIQVSNHCRHLYAYIKCDYHMILVQINRTDNQMLIEHSENFGMLLTTTIDLKNDEPAEKNFSKNNFGNFIKPYL